VAGAGAALTGCGPLGRRLTERPDQFEPLPPGNVQPDRRLLDRVTFGPRPGDLEELREIGHEAFVKRELLADRPDTLALKLQLSRLDALQMEAYDLRDLPEDTVLGQLQQAAILRAVHGENGLQERMVEFWTDHFSIYGRKGLSGYRKGADERDVIRKHALGRFGDMLRASAHSPAMLMFLDNPFNQKGGPNENYAREIMELHSLGVDGGYTQQDVEEVARCFTGWRLERRFLRHRGAFRFDPDLHDDGEKTVLGVRIPAGGGQQDGERVLDILAEHPSTARFISRKLCRYFLGEAGSKWEARTEKTFRETGGDIRSMLEPLLLSKELLDAPPIFKRPFDYVASALRAVGGVTDGGKPLQDHLASMGQPLYQWPMPDGFPTKTSAWTGTMLGRWNFAFALAEGRIGGTSAEWAALAGERPPVDATVEGILARKRSAKDEVLEKWADRPEMVAALCLATPEFQWR
jgi:uncharacterized protein (DUF1800 family)